MAGMRCFTNIKVGDKVKLIHNHLRKHESSNSLVVGSVYNVIEILDDYFDGAYIIFEVDGNRESVFPVQQSKMYGFGTVDKWYVDRFEVIGSEEEKNSFMV